LHLTHALLPFPRLALSMTERGAVFLELVLLQKPCRLRPTFMPLAPTRPFLQEESFTCRIRTPTKVASKHTSPLSGRMGGRCLLALLLASALAPLLRVGVLLAVAVHQLIKDMGDMRKGKGQGAVRLGVSLKEHGQASRDRTSLPQQGLPCAVYIKHPMGHS
jgi:hypothetical protein